MVLRKTLHVGLEGGAMKSLLLGLMFAVSLLTVEAQIQYHCYFGELVRHPTSGDDGDSLEFCVTQIPSVPFLTKGDFLRTEEPEPCYECLCEDDGLACCECERQPTG